MQAVVVTVEGQLGVRCLYEIQNHTSEPVLVQCARRNIGLVLRQMVVRSQDYVNFESLMIPELQEEMTIKEDSYITEHVEWTGINVKVGREKT